MAASAPLQEQQHLWADWPAGREDEKAAFLAQLTQLDGQYGGGLAQYVANAKQLLSDSKAGVNPLDGWAPSVPTGEIITPGSADYAEFEKLGASVAGDTVFVLVAGGLGERLGYSGIKVALPTETLTGQCYLEYYCKYILQLCPRNPCLVIMTSDDTDAPTRSLLEANGHFGMPPSAVVLLKQNKVAAIADNDANLALKKGDRFTIETKPHGHGDVHYLIYEAGLTSDWVAEGRKHIIFFQDTNALIFKVLRLSLSVPLGASLSLSLYILLYIPLALSLSLSLCLP